MLEFLLRLLWCSAVAALAYFVLGTFGKDMAALRAPLTILFTSPIWAQNFTRYVIEIIPAIRRVAARSAHEPWSGRYYSYDGKHIRFYRIDDIIWVVEADVMSLLQPKPDTRELRFLGDDYAIIPEQKFQGFTQAGLMRLLISRTSTRSALPEMIKFRRWIEYEAFPNVARLPGSSAK